MRPILAGPGRGSISSRPPLRRPLAPHVALERAAVDAEQLGGGREVLVGGGEHALNVLVDDVTEAHLLHVEGAEIGEREIAAASERFPTSTSFHRTRLYINTCDNTPRT